MMKHVTKLSVAGMCLLSASGFQARAAVMITPVANSYSITTVRSQFTTWAEANGATNVGGFGTYNTGYGTQSGATASSTEATLTIPFALSSGTFATAILDLNAVIRSYGGNFWNNIPNCSVSAIVDGTPTLVFDWTSPNQLPSQPTPYNYNGAAPALGQFGSFNTTVDLTNLVAGETSFSLVFRSKEGFANELGNGAAFYQSWNDATNPFKLSGTTIVPEPASLAMLGLGAVALLRRRR